MGKSLVVLLFVVAGGLAAAPAVLQAKVGLPRRVNCGDLNGFPSGEPGYELLSETQFPPDVLLIPPALDTVHVAGNFPNYYGTLPLPSDVLSVDPDQLHRTHRMTALELADQTVLQVANLQPKAYHRVRLELGALYPWIDLVDPIKFGFYPTISREVRVEVQEPADSGPVKWRTAAHALRCTTGHDAVTYASNVSGILSCWVLARTDPAGTLRLRLSTDGQDPLFLAGFELHKWELLPVLYRHVGVKPLQAFTPGVNAFVNAFNSGDYQGAETLALAMADPFERGTALVHLIGWLDGGRDGFVHRIPDARAALAAAGTHPAACWLLAELEAFERALDHLDARGYRSAYATPQEGGKGYLNPDSAGQILSISALNLVNANAHIALRELRGLTAPAEGATVLEDLVQWNLGAIPAGVWEPSPLVFAALKLTAATILTMNPKLKVSPSDPESVALAEDRDAVFNGLVDLGFAAVDFASDLELLLFDAYVNAGDHPSQWDQADLEGLLTDQQIAASWWGPEVALLPDDPAAPKWANLQRNQVRISRNLAAYWIEERLRDGELGGGLGDDVELLGQLSMIYAGRRDQADRRAVDGMDDMVRYGLYTSGEVVDGYYGGEMTDVEHSGEYTTGPYLATHNLFGHAARAGETALGVAKHLRYSSQPAKAFAGETNLGRLHFKSYQFTSEGPSPDPAFAMDILLNGRAVYPAVAASLHAPLSTGHPMLADLRNWALAWRTDALDTTGGKPEGWYGPVQWPSNTFGKGGYWWSQTGSASDVSGFSSGVYTYTLELMRSAYHRSISGWRWKYLLPAVRMFRAVKSWEDQGKPSAPAGSELWAAAQFKTGYRFGALVVDHLADLKNDGDLNTLIDPLGSGGTYVDGALIARMETWAEDEWNGQHTMIKYALGELETTGHKKAKPTANIEDTYGKVIAYYRAVFPLLTRHVLHTDRVFLTYQGGGPGNLMAAPSGEVLTEGLAYRPLARWRDRLGNGRDLAVQCNHRDYDAAVYSAFVHSFEGAALETTLMLDEGLVPGRYLVEWGQATAASDLFPDWAAVYSKELQKRGRGLATQVTVQPGLNLVRATRLGDADQLPSGYDLSVDPPVAELVKGPGSFDLVFKARVANLGRTASPAATLNLYVSLILPDGAVLPLPGLPEEIFLAAHQVPALPATTGWTLQQIETTLPVPVNSLIIAILVSGLGFQIRAEVTADGLEEDLLNNDQTRAWLLSDMGY